MSLSIEKIIADARLPSLPDIYLRLKQVMDEPDFAMSDVAAVISQDPAITARVLRMVNSPYFGFASRIDTVSRAAGMLGTHEIHDLVLASSVAQLFNGIANEVMNMARFWRNSIYCALLARLAANRCRLIEAEQLFVAGLLCQIGHLVMYQSHPEISQQILQQAADGDKPRYVIERKLFGFDYAQVGSMMMQKWSLPKSLWEVTGFHTDPARTREYCLEISIIHIISLFTDAIQLNTAEEYWLDQIHPKAWANTGLHPEQILDMKSDADEQLALATEMLFGSVVAAA